MSAFTGLADQIRHDVAVFVERIVNDRDGRDDERIRRDDFRIELGEAGFVEAAAAASGCGMAQMLERAAIFRVGVAIGRLALDVKDGDECLQRVVVHLAEDHDVRIFRA